MQSLSPLVVAAGLILGPSFADAEVPGGSFRRESSTVQVPGPVSPGECSAPAPGEPHVSCACFDTEAGSCTSGIDEDGDGTLDAGVGWYYGNADERGGVGFCWLEADGWLDVGICGFGERTSIPMDPDADNEVDFVFYGNEGRFEVLPRDGSSWVQNLYRERPSGGTYSYLNFADYLPDQHVCFTGFGFGSNRRGGIGIDCVDTDSQIELAPGRLGLDADQDGRDELRVTADSVGLPFLAGCAVLSTDGSGDLFCGEETPVADEGVRRRVGSRRAAAAPGETEDAWVFDAENIAPDTATRGIVRRPHWKLEQAIARGPGRLMEMWCVASGGPIRSGQIEAAVRLGPTGSPSPSYLTGIAVTFTPGDGWVEGVAQGTVRGDGSRASEIVPLVADGFGLVITATPDLDPPSVDLYCEVKVSGPAS